MPSSSWKLEILARRATFCAMALAGTGTATTACDKDGEKGEPTEQVDPLECLSMRGSTRPKGEEGSMGRPQPCLRGVLAPASATAKLDHDYPFSIKDKGKIVAKGTILARVEGPDVPHAAEIATGSHIQARIRPCFLDAANKGTKIEGEAELTLEVSPQGDVEKVSTSGTLDPSLRACLAEKVENLGFHPVEGGGRGKVIVALFFSKKS